MQNNDPDLSLIEKMPVAVYTCNLKEHAFLEILQEVMNSGVPYYRYEIYGGR